MKLWISMMGDFQTEQVACGQHECAEAWLGNTSSRIRSKQRAAHSADSELTDRGPSHTQKTEEFPPRSPAVLYSVALDCL